MREVRDSQGQAYCKKYNQEIEVTSGVVKLYFGGGVESGSQALCGEEDNSWQVVMVMQDASLVSISLPGNLMFVIEVGLASMQMVQTSTRPTNLPTREHVFSEIYSF